MEAEEFAKLFGSPVNRACSTCSSSPTATRKTPASTGEREAAQNRVGRRRRRRHHGAGHRGRQREARHSRRADGRRPGRARPRRAGRARRSRVQQADSKGPTCKRAVELAPLVNGTLSDVELCRSRPGHRSDRRKRRGQAAAVRPARAAAAATTRSWLEHLDDSDHAAGRGPGAARAVLRHSLFQSGAADAAGGSDPRRARRATRRSPRPSPTPSTLGKSPIVVNDGPGFLVNRLLLPYMNEAAAAAVRRGRDQGRSSGRPKTFGMPMGPITLYDVVGLDTAVHAGRMMAEAFPDRVVPAPICRASWSSAAASARKRARASSTTAGQRRQAAARHRQRRSRPADRRVPHRRRSESSRTKNSPTACSCRCCSKPRACWKTRSCATCATSTWA